MNRFMIERGLACKWAHSSALDVNKVAKWGPLGGIWREVQMNVQMVRYLGLVGYLRQLLTFCREELPRARPAPRPEPQPV